MGHRGGGRRGGGRSSRSSKSRSRSSSRSSGTSRSKSSGPSSSSSSRGGSRSGSSGSRSGSSRSSNQAQASAQTATAKTLSTQGNMSQTPRIQTKNIIKGVAPGSKEMQTINAIYERQRITRELNKEKQKMTQAMRNAKSAKEAIAIRNRYVKQNKFLASQPTLSQANKLIAEAGKEGFVKTGPTGKPIGMVVPKTDIFKDGQQVGSITGSSPGAQFGFAQPKQTIRSTKSIFDTIPKAAAQPEISHEGFLSEKQKAFEFFPEIPTGKEPLDRLSAGFVKGSSNVVAGFGNVGVGVHNFFAPEGKKVNEFGFYSTPVTNLETAFFGVGVSAVKKGIGDKDYADYSTDKAGKEITTGFEQAGENFFKDPFGSAGSMVEIAPYLGVAAVKGGAKLITGFLGKTKYSKSLKKSDDFFALDKKKGKTTDMFSKAYWDKGPKPSIIPTVKTPKVTAAKPGYTAKQVTDYWTGKDYFKSTSKAGQVTVQKTKQVTKAKQNVGLKFFNVQKVKTKQKGKLGVTPLLVPKTLSKTKSKVTTRQAAAMGIGTAAGTTAVTATDFFRSSASTAGMTAAQKRRLRDGYYSGQRKGLNRGKKVFVGWNVDPNKVGEFLEGPAYKKSYSAGQINADLGIRTTKAAKKRKRQKKKTGLEFFNS